MSWEKVKLGNVSESCLGKMLDQRKNKGTYKPYLANVNVRWGSFDLNNLQEMKFEEGEDERYGIKYGDLIICEGGEPGRCAIWKEELPNMKIQKALHRVRVNEEMDYRYVYYWFLLAGKQGALKQYYTGATIMHIPGQKLKEVVIDKPPLGVQRRIGYYLESFDNLIENNQKQIKLLEEAAQRLYKRWFIDLRFPGYENVKIVDGVPEKWEKVSLAEIAPIVTGKKDANFGINSGKYLFFTCAQEPIKAPSYSFDCDAVILAGNGDFNVKLYRGRFEAYQRTYVFSPYNSNNLYLLYYAVKDNMCQLFQGASGSTIKFLTRRMLEDILVFVPDEKVLIQFNRNCELFQKKIEALKAQIILAQEIRDRLLPKLMSGEIEVCFE
jgi:type I restriction enzyme S subunit